MVDQKQRSRYQWRSNENNKNTHEAVFNCRLLRSLRLGFCCRVPG